jgi:exopolysaccharide biosynthesis polyprenyl glycosylphosphotransferase
MKRPVATEQAPPAQPKPAPSRRDDDLDPAAPLGDIRSTTPYLPFQGAIRRSASVVALVVLDLVGLVLGVYTALTLRAFVYGNDVSQWGLRWKVETDWLPFLTVITVLVFWRAGLYTERERRAGFGRILASLALVAVITLIFTIGTGHNFQTYGLAPTAVLTSAAFIGLLRGSYDVTTSDLLKFAGVRRRAILVGTGESLARLRRTLGASRGGIDYEFVGALSTSPDSAGLHALGPPSGLPAVLAAHQVDELIVTDSDFSDRELMELVEQAHRRGVKVRVAPRATELLIERRGEYVPGQGVPLFELRPPVFVGADWFVKRGFDLVVSAIVAIVGLPLWAFIALAIKVDSRGPVFYRDSRIGLNENEFGMIKFRTMRADAEAQQAALERENEAEGALFKIKDDPRITRVGGFLRRFSIDEIPQVLNVLRGEMSLVGPRPLPVRDYKLLEPWHRKRYLVLPGMTGLWQVAGRSSLGFDDLVRLDFYYLEHWSIWLDVSILLKTIPAVLNSRGAY